MVAAMRSVVRTSVDERAITELHKHRSTALGTHHGAQIRIIDVHRYVARF